MNKDEEYDLFITTHTEDEAKSIFDLYGYTEGYIEGYKYEHLLFDFDSVYENKVNNFSKENNLDNKKIFSIFNILNYQIANISESNDCHFYPISKEEKLEKEFFKIKKLFFDSLTDFNEYNLTNGRFDTLGSLELEIRYKQAFFNVSTKINYIASLCKESYRTEIYTVNEILINLFYNNKYSEMNYYFDIIMDKYILPFVSELKSIDLEPATKIKINQFNFDYIDEEWLYNTSGVNQDFINIFYSCYLFLLEYGNTEIINNFCTKKLKDNGCPLKCDGHFDQEYCYSNINEQINKDEIIFKQKSYVSKLKKLFNDINFGDKSFINLISKKTPGKKNITRDMFFPSKINYKKNTDIPCLLKYL